MMRSPIGDEQFTSSLGPMEEHGDWRSRLFFPLRGNVLAVYPLDDEKNEAHATFCDIQLHDGYPTLHRVWIGRAGFQQETKEPGPAGHRWRNAYPPRKQNGTNGWAMSVMPGDLVLVQFVGGRWSEPFISDFWPASNQGRENDDHPYGGGYPFNQQSRYRMEGSAIAEEITKRLDATAAQAPQWTWAFNGAFIEILNDGTLLLQSSSSRDALVPTDKPKVGLKQSPTPTGDFVMSTRGAVHGDLVLTTGKSDGSGETNDGGNVLVLSYAAKQGNVIVNLATADEGNIIALGSQRTASQVFLRVLNESDYLHIQGGLSELSGSEKISLRSNLVMLGRRGADRSAVTWEELTEVIGQLCMMFDTHKHPGVERGNSNTDPPDIFQSPYFEVAKKLFRSGVVFLELDHAKDEPMKPQVDEKRGISEEAREIERPTTRASSYKSQRTRTP